jgi:uncharacterized membrane protein
MDTMANRIVFLAGLLVVAASTLSLSPSTIVPTPEYSIDDLGTLPGDASSYAWGINELGAVVGGSEGPGGMRAFLFTRGGIAALPCPAGRPHCLARDVNGAGQAVGSAWTSGVDWPGHAVRWTQGVPEDLGVLGVGFQSEAWGINGPGAVVGYSYVGGGLGPHGFLFADPHGMADATPADAQGYVYDINDAGWRTGYRLEAGGYRAVRWGDGITETFGVLPGLAHSFGTAINGRDQVAGYSKSARGDVERIIRYTDGVGLENLGGAYDRNRAWGINARGDVVGEGRPGSGPVRAVLYRDGHGLQELNRLIDPKLGWFLVAATDINDAGEIVGYGSNLYRPGTHAVRLTPNRVEDAPRGLRLEGVWPDTIRLSWNPVAVAEFYRVYESEDRFARFPWRVLGETATTSFDAAGHFGDGRAHYYVVRAVRGTDEGGNSTMAVKVPVSFPYPQDSTHIAWFSLPYASRYARASDIAAALGPSRIDVVGKWDPSRQSSIVFYHTGGGYRGDDFPVGPGDGLYLGLRQGFDWAWMGTDSDARLEFRLNPAPAGNVAWFGVPYTSVYRHASDIARELGPDRIAEVGRWNADLQSAERWVWTGTQGSGTDFPIRPGDALYVIVISDFSWRPALLTAVVP